MDRSSDMEQQMWDSRTRGSLAALLAARAQPPVCPQPQRVMGTCSSHACQPLDLPQALQMLEPAILAAVPAPTQTSWSGRQPCCSSQKLQSSQLPTQALHPLTPHPAGPQLAARPSPAAPRQSGPAAGALAAFCGGLPPLLSHRGRGQGLGSRGQPPLGAGRGPHCGQALGGQ